MSEKRSALDFTFIQIAHRLMELDKALEKTKTSCTDTDAVLEFQNGRIDKLRKNDIDQDKAIKELKVSVADTADDVSFIRAYYDKEVFMLKSDIKLIREAFNQSKDNFEGTLKSYRRDLNIAYVMVFILFANTLRMIL